MQYQNSLSTIKKSQAYLLYQLLSFVNDLLLSLNF